MKLYILFKQNVCKERLSFSAGLQKSTGGVAYDYILKPAADAAPKISSPPKEKPLTHDEIIEKLQKAEERRQVSKPKCCWIGKESFSLSPKPICIFKVYAKLRYMYYTSS